MCVLIYIVQKKPSLTGKETNLIVSSTSSNIIKLGNVQKPKVQVVYHPRRLAEIGHFRFVILSLGFFFKDKNMLGSILPKKDPKLAVEKHLL